MNAILGLILFSISMIANAGDDISLNVSTSETTFIVTLAANPTTGYQWTVVKYDKKLLTLVSSIYQRAKTNLIGAGGQMLFTFSLKKGKKYPASTSMLFKYARSWEANSSKLQEVTVNFTP